MEDIHKILELYSGIGGMHCAWKESGLHGEVVAAVDINTIANQVYTNNFPTTFLANRNIQSLKPSEIDKWQVNTILMSPPCQPFTRNGKYLDENDARADSFTYLCGILDQLENVEYILLENVKGFECSSARKLFIAKLEANRFDYQEFLLCPTSVGIPNSRLRYYCIARRTKSPWKFKRKEIILHSLPGEYGLPYSLENILESDVTDEYTIPDKLLRRANIFDICYTKSRRSCCFTKAYTHYIEGTGSVLTNATEETVKKFYEEANTFKVGSEEFVKSICELQLRFFTPKEVLRLMTFPKNFIFPENITKRQCYRLLGNSINVKVVSELLKVLYD